MSIRHCSSYNAQGSSAHLCTWCPAVLGWSVHPPSILLPWCLIFPRRKQLGDQLLEQGGRWQGSVLGSFPNGTDQQGRGNWPKDSVSGC